jgi:hypothetical protein
MARQPQVSADFLADLDVVCPKGDDGSLPLTFLKDLEIAYAHARVLSLQEPIISVADLTSLAEDLKAWRSYHQQLLQQYLAQLPCDDPLRSPVSLFGTMDYGRLETAHTRALAWLLNDREHGFGFQLLESLLLYLVEGRQIGLTHVDKVESEYPVYCGPGSADGGRIDILAEGRWEELGNEASWRLVIEAKIDAEEGEEQLPLYDDWLEHCPQPAEVLRVFLTPDGREPGTSSAEWQVLSFLDLASIFRRAAGLQDRPGYHFLRYYLTGVLRDVCRLPVPISSDCENPYVAVDYLQSVLGATEAEDDDGQSR